ncbi:hypothetical protein MBLNU459_g4768t3 [Dothideomycetes sp. NU459]
MQIRMPIGSDVPLMMGFPTSPMSPTKFAQDFLQPRRRIQLVRLVAFSLAVSLCYLIATRASAPSKWVPAVVQGAHEHLGQLGINITYGGGVSHEDALAHFGAKHGDKGKSSLGHSQNKPFVAHNVGDGTVYSFKEALSDVLYNVPDEIYLRDLIRPIVGGGQERLKEVGVRTRAFSKFFSLWEALHVVADDKMTYIRDDVIQYLENAPAEELTEISRMERGDMIRAYERYRFFLMRLSGILFPWTAPYFADHMTLHAHISHGGRGIVLSGNDKQAPFFLTSIESFRKLGCNLPVEIMYLGDQDLGDDWRTQLEALPGVTTRDLSQMVSDRGWELKGWASKAFALLMSSFREVIYLDADALFFVNPETLFDDPGYVETGALFFMDRVYAPESRKQWLRDVLPKPISKKAQTSRFWTGRSREQQESGALVVDKWRHFVSMLTITRLNGPDRDDNPNTGDKGVYSLFYGDKETFWLGFELAGDTEYWFHQGAAGAMGVVSEEVQYTLTDGHATFIYAENEAEGKEIHTLYTVNSPQLLHLDLDGRPIWWNGWIVDDKYEDKMAGAVSKMEVFLSEEKTTGEFPEWAVGGHNMATLKSDQMFEFTEDELDVWNMIVDVARENGALNKHGL